jgi:protein SHQ1
VLKLGKVACLKALLGMKIRLDASEQSYALGKIWVDDYCAWVQGCDGSVLKELGEIIDVFECRKDEIGFDLARIEEGALNGEEEYQ